MYIYSGQKKSQWTQTYKPFKSTNTTKEAFTKIISSKVEKVELQVNRVRKGFLKSNETFVMLSLPPASEYLSIGPGRKKQQIPNLL